MLWHFIVTNYFKQKQRFSFVLCTAVFWFYVLPVNHIYVFFSIQDVHTFYVHYFFYIKCIEPLTTNLRPTVSYSWFEEPCSGPSNYRANVLNFAIIRAFEIFLSARFQSHLGSYLLLSKNHLYSGVSIVFMDCFLFLGDAVMFIIFAGTSVSSVVKSWCFICLIFDSMAVSTKVW